jgi:hypothetical protein
MHSTRMKERGEGKIGCVVTFLVLVAAGALAYKLVPVFYTNMALQDFGNDLTTRAGVMGVNDLTVQLRAKARELQIPEALAKGAMSLTVNGSNSAGVCTVQFHYSRQVDLYGFYTLTIDTDKTITNQYMDVR